MKLRCVFLVIALFVSLDISYCLSNKITADKRIIDKLEDIPEPYTAGKEAPTPTISEAFFLQKFYAGKDPILFMQKSEKDAKLKYFVVQGSNFYYGENSLTRSIIQGNYE